MPRTALYDTATGQPVAGAVTARAFQLDGTPYGAAQAATDEGSGLYRVSLSGVADADAGYVRWYEAGVYLAGSAASLGGPTAAAIRALSREEADAALARYGAAKQSFGLDALLLDPSKVYHAKPLPLTTPWADDALPLPAGGVAGERTLTGADGVSYLVYEGSAASLASASEEERFAAYRGEVSPPGATAEALAAVKTRVNGIPTLREPFQRYENGQPVGPQIEYREP